MALSHENKVLSPAFCDFVQKQEGVVLTSYRCPAGVWTIGCGHTKNVIKGQTITYATALSYLLSDLREVYLPLYKLYGSKISIGHYQALVDFCFNLGFGSFKKSALKRVIDSAVMCDTLDKTYPAIEYQLMRWVNCNGKSLKGLISRREAECKLLSNPL